MRPGMMKHMAAPSPLVRRACAALALALGCSSGRVSVEEPAVARLCTRVQQVPVTPARELPRTVVAASLRHPIGQGRNVVWCASLQLAWNKAVDLVGGPVKLEGTPALVDGLNERLVGEGDVDPAAALSIAGTIGDGVLDRVVAQLKGCFPGGAGPKLLSNVDPQTERDVVIYARMLAALPFEAPFEKIYIFWGDRTFDAFGIEEHKRETRRQGRQVLVHRYESPEDVVVELVTESRDDRLLLARVRPAATLLETCRRVVSRLSDRPDKMRRGDTLRVPAIRIAVRKSWENLTGRALENRRWERSWLHRCVQDVVFSLDEQGAALSADALLQFAWCMRRQRYIMEFNRPFLVMLLRKGSELPYLAIWIDNDELLSPASDGPWGRAADEEAPRPREE